MFDFLNGTLVSVQSGQVVLATGGIGWSITASTKVTASLKEGTEGRLYLHLAVSDSALSLFGFPTQQERALFRRLIQVSGVGPTSAMSLLSGLTPSEFLAAIANEDPVPLTAAKGIGRKTAERLVLELRDHIEALRKDAPEANTSPSTDLARVLCELGVQEKAAQLAARKAFNDLGADAAFEDLLRAALQTPTSS